METIPPIPANSTYCLTNFQAGDEEFLFRVYACTRAEELSVTPWTDEQKEAFLRMQFDAQTRHYQVHFPQASHWIINVTGRPAGRLILNRTENSLLIIDIALLREFRNQGIGSSILADLMQMVRVADLRLVLRVEFFNPAVRLYERLGFVRTREVNSVYHEMIWPPEAVKSEDA